MKKPETKTKPRNEPRNHDPSTAGPSDWTPLFAAFRDAFEWALDVAAAIARDYPEEADAVERVRSFMRRRIAGEVADIAIDDVMLTFALVIGAIERDLDPIAHARPSLTRTRLRLPSARELGHPPIPHYVVWSLDAAPLAA